MKFQPVLISGVTTGQVPFISLPYSTAGVVFGKWSVRCRGKWRGKLGIWSEMSFKCLTACLVVITIHSEADSKTQTEIQKKKKHVNFLVHLSTSIVI